MPPLFKPIAPDEQSQAVDLWHDVFGDPKDYFTRYYADDPWYQAGDSLGAWVDGELVSAVHLCRRPLGWEGTTVLCGGIANVATRPEYRGQGLSRKLLSLLIARMDEQKFAFSGLGTGIPDFYAPLGWEEVRLPRFEITLADTLPASEHRFSAAIPTEEVVSHYAPAPRVLQQERPAQYFSGWAGWVWASGRAQVLSLPTGYVVLDSPTGEGRPARVQEWRAGDAASEIDLLREAALQARVQGRQQVAFAALPQHAALSALEPLGVVKETRLASKMVRNISLSERDYAGIREAYLSGQAAWWPADGF